jgi:hypothetical protein
MDRGINCSMNTDTSEYIGCHMCSNIRDRLSRISFGASFGKLPDDTHQFDDDHGTQYHGHTSS